MSSNSTHFKSFVLTKLFKRNKIVLCTLETQRKMIIELSKDISERKKNLELCRRASVSCRAWKWWTVRLVISAIGELESYRFLWGFIILSRKLIPHLLFLYTFILNHWITEIWSFDSYMNKIKHSSFHC